MMAHTNTPHDATHADGAADVRSREAPRPYAAPTLTALGSVEAVTAGPDNGSIDQLVGGGGGFRQADPTS